MTILPFAATRRPAPQLDPHNAAIAWFFRHGHGLARLEALGGCVGYLMGELAMSERAAEAAAMQAYGEVTTVNQRARIDADLTTAYMVALNTGEGHVMLTVSDLMAAVEQARQAGHVKRVERHATH